MNRRSLLAFLGLGAAAAPALAAQQKSGAKHSVILQVSDKDPVRWNLALNNARNVQADLGPENVQIEIVAYGPGLEMLKAESTVAGDRLGSAVLRPELRRRRVQALRLRHGPLRALPLADA